jgi:hypothetical protein
MVETGIPKLEDKDRDYLKVKTNPNMQSWAKSGKKLLSNFQNSNDLLIRPGRNQIHVRPQQKTQHCVDERQNLRS